LKGGQEETRKHCRADGSKQAKKTDQKRVEVGKKKEKRVKYRMRGTQRESNTEQKEGGGFRLSSSEPLKRSNVGGDACEEVIWEEHRTRKKEVFYHFLLGRETSGVARHGRGKVRGKIVKEKKRNKGLDP